MNARRTVDDLEDTEIVTTVASFGMSGRHAWDVLERLGMRVGDAKTDRGLADALYERLYKRPIAEIRVSDARIMLTPAEWARRLAHRPAEDIERMLSGAK